MTILNTFIYSFFLYFTIVTILTSGLLGYRIKNHTNRILSINYIDYYIFFIGFILYLLLLFIFPYFYEFITVYAADNSEKSTVILENTTVNFYGLKAFAESIGNATAFNSGILAAAKLLKSSSFPPVYKAAFVGASGVGSLLIFNQTKRMMPTDNTSTIVDVNTEVQKINNTMHANAKFKLNADSNQFEANSPLEGEDLMQISNLIDILDNALIINLLIMIIILMTIGFFFFNSISRSNLLNNLERNKLPLVSLGINKRILSLLTYLINLWGKTSTVWGFIGFFIIFIFTSFNTFTLFYLSQQFHQIF